MWFRNVFIAQLGEAVIGRDKEVEAADVMYFIVWRAVGRYGTGVVIPLQLDCMRLMLPGLDGTKVNLLLVKLGGRTDKGGAGLAFPVALAVTVVEGDITY